jgi:competence ComEA-like helix-hairpin-helix protein
MKNIGLVTWLSSILFFWMILAYAGTAFAQHTGGLGEKRIPLNIATLKQLMKIEGMTEDLAKAIVEYREKSGYFKKPEDLLKVPGITQEVFKKLDPQVGTEGDIYCVPKQGAEDEEEDEDVPLSPSKC